MKKLLSLALLLIAGIASPVYACETAKPIDEKATLVKNPAEAQEEEENDSSDVKKTAEKKEEAKAAA